MDVLKQQGIVPGIKVDTGLQVLPGTDGETATQGLVRLPRGLQGPAGVSWVLAGAEGWHAPGVCVCVTSRRPPHPPTHLHPPPPHPSG